MVLRCLLFSSDDGTAEPIRQVLTGLGVEGEYCSEAVAAAEKVTNQNFQIVIIDWDKQPEAPLLLTTARGRKASERPLTLAIVSDDASVPTALQAGANSILRKPLLVNQVRDTLTTARDLLRTRQESAANAAAAGASAGPSSTLPPAGESTKESHLQGQDFLRSSSLAPGSPATSTPASGSSAPAGQFVTKSDHRQSLQPVSAVAPAEVLRDLESMTASESAPVTASVTASVNIEKPVPAPPPSDSPARGLEWYLKTRAGALPPTETPIPAPPPPEKPELLGYGQTPAVSAPPRASSNKSAAEATPNPRFIHEQKREHKKEAELFAYMAGESGESKKAAPSRFRMGKRAIIGALLLASCAIAAAPQAPWHSTVRMAWARGYYLFHGWLNPQAVTAVQPTVAHENFYRAGDEYKMPIAENIPDATTDPSQIQVVPVVDPTAKKPANEGTNSESLTEGTTAPPGDQPPSSSTSTPTPENQALPSTSAPVHTESAQPESTQPEAARLEHPPAATANEPAPGVAVSAVPAPTRSDPFTAASPHTQITSAIPSRPLPSKVSQPRAPSTPGNVPSSLKSHVVSMTPDAGGNKLPESAMASIEPVAVSELAERALLTEQPAMAYPANAKGQSGTVVLQVLIGRDGTVQDAKFLQGSLAFARTAIDGVKQWKFKPYAMNGRAVSVQTLLTISFKPTP
jgi:TonB family protein